METKKIQIPSEIQEKIKDLETAIKVLSKSTQRQDRDILGLKKGKGRTETKD